MLNKEGIAGLRERLSTLHKAGTEFFDKAERHDQEDLIGRSGISNRLGEEADALRGTVKRLSVDIAGAARGSPLIAEADFHDLRHNTRRILASIHFNEYRYFGIYIHHDEGTFIGADPPSQAEAPVSVEAARQLFEKAIARSAT